MIKIYILHTIYQPRYTSVNRLELRKQLEAIKSRKHFRHEASKYFYILVLSELLLTGQSIYETSETFPAPSANHGNESG